MTTLGVVIVLTALGAEAAHKPVPVGEPTPRQVRSAIERSLPFLADEGENWMQIQRCNSCHRVPFLLWSHHEALERGIDLDRKKLDDWTKWALADTFEDRHWFKLRDWTPDALRTDGVPESVVAKLAPVVGQLFLKEEEMWKAVKAVLSPMEVADHRDRLLRRATQPNNGGGPDTLSQLILARAPLPADPAMRESYVAVKRVLLEWQEPDGHWVGQGQQPDQRRPRSEMNECTTMWAIIALSAAEGVGDPGTGARSRALAWLKDRRPGVSTESLMLLSMIEHRYGEKVRADGLLAELVGEQKPDGGWSWVRRAEVSDAFATGQVLYALGLMGRGEADPAVRRAWAFLLRTQDEDGAWSVPAAPITTKTGEALAKVKDGYNFWGTAWATIGLARTMHGGDVPFLAVEPKRRDP